MVSNVLRAIILDIDGTLVNTGLNWCEVRRALKEVVGTADIPKPLAKSLPEIVKEKDKLVRAFKLIEKLELESALGVNRDVELVELLKQFKEKYKLKLAVVTLRAKNSALIILSKLGILNLIDVLVTREETPDRKSQLIRILNNLGLSRTEVIFLGDTEEDLRAGRELGIRTRLMPGHYNTVGVPKELKKFLRELKKFLGRASREESGYGPGL